MKHHKEKRQHCLEIRPHESSPLLRKLMIIFYDDYKQNLRNEDLELKKGKMDFI